MFKQTVLLCASVVRKVGAAIAAARSVTLPATALPLVLQLALALVLQEAVAASEVAIMVYKTTAQPPVTSVEVLTTMPVTVRHRL